MHNALHRSLRNGLDGQDKERTDTLPSADAFTLSPFHDSKADRQSGERADGPPASHIEILKQLRRLRRRPGFALLANSVLLLHTVQLDLDYPMGWPAYARMRLAGWLSEMAGKPLDPNRVMMHLNSEHTWVDEQGQEHDELQCSLSQLAILNGDLQHSRQLAQATPADDSPLPDLPHLSARSLLRQLLEQPWADEYEQQLERFWRYHADTWRQLARVSWLDELARQLKRRQIHHEAYHLALDAIGYRDFPDSPQALQRTDPARNAQVWLLYLNDEPVPGLLQVRSTNTSHCFIYRPGSGLIPVEYISDAPGHMTERLLAALNDSPAHRQWLFHQQPVDVQARLYSGDPLKALQQAAQACAEDFWLAGSEVFLWRSIKPALSLASATDLWQTQPAILQTLPEPLRLAGSLMQDWLRKDHDLELDPHQVFVAWRPGRKRTPLGHVRHAGSRIHTPASKPVSLAQALVSRFQATQPEGYIDEGGKWAIWHDASAKGKWQADKQLPITAQQLQAQIRSIDFLSLMTRRIEAFWSQQQAQIEQALRSMLINQAIAGLKQGHLRRRGFDTVVKALNAPSAHWSVLGFQVQSSFLEGLEHQPCASLLLLSPDSGPSRVLYQAGQPRAFIEFADETALHHYLHGAMADAHWRAAVMRYVPERHRLRLDYLFRLWAGQAGLWPPASITRPWLDNLYQPDRHKTPEQSQYAHRLPPGQPFAFMCQTLKDNALEHARQTIMTPEQQMFAYWRTQLLHLQWLLAPMSLMLTPGAIAAIATELGLLGLDLALAQLPGPRYAEKQQALLSLLSFALWRVAPATPRLLSALDKATGNGRSLLRSALAMRGARPSSGGAVSAPPGRLFNTLTPARQTRLARFFHTNSLLKRWTLSGPQFGALPVHAWKLGRKFLIWTSDRGQARTLVVSTHGYYLPWSKTVKIPNGTQLHTYAPHGHVLIDPGLHKVVSQRVGPYGISTGAGQWAAQTPLVATDKLLAGTSLPGRLKNYSLAKYQGAGTESYNDISRVVRNSNSRLYSGQMPPTPMDVLSIRNRFASLPPSLEDLFGQLALHGIHYDQILLVHCRCAAFSGLLNRAPVYQVPDLPPVRPISP